MPPPPTQHLFAPGKVSSAIAVPRPTARQLIRAAYMDFFLPWRKHTKIILIGAIVLAILIAAAGFFVAPQYFGERNSVAQRTSLVALNSAVELQKDAGPYVEALQVHRNMARENLADLDTRLKSTRLVKHLGRDYLTPLRVALARLETELSYEKKLKANGVADLTDISSLSDDGKKSAEADAKALIFSAAKKFREVSDGIKARPTGEQPLPAPSPGDLNFNAAGVEHTIDLFLTAAAACLESRGADLEKVWRLAGKACLASRVAQAAIEFGLPEAAASKSVVLKIQIFHTELEKLRAHTADLAGKFSADPERAKQLRQYADSEARRLALLDELMRHHYALHYPALRSIYVAASSPVAAALPAPGSK